MKKALAHGLGPAIGILLFAAALWVLQRTLAKYDYHDVIDYLRALPNQQLLLAFICAGFSYLIMTGYDLLAMHYIRRNLPWFKTGFAAFISYAFSNAIGLSVLTSGSVRYRLYSSWGLTAVDVTKIVMFTGLTMWLGILAISGSLLVWQPVELPILSSLAPWANSQWLGLLMLTVPAFYVLLGWLRRRPFQIWHWEFTIVTPKLACLQIVIGALDWLMVSSVLYALLPVSDTLSFGYFLGTFLIAQTVGLLSHVPGGLGVFESLVLLLLTGFIPAADALGALLGYRLIYYLVPLALATLGLGIYEGRFHTQRVLKLPYVISTWISVLLPYGLALMALSSGVLLLISTATPTEASRLVWLSGFLPLAVLEISHFAAALLGIGLVFLARGLQSRLEIAYLLSVVLLPLGIVAALLKGFDYEIALFLGVLLIGLLPCRQEFYRHTALLDETFTAGWIATIALIPLCVLWIGLFSFKHVEYTVNSLWHFSFTADASRFLRAILGTLGLTLLIVIAKRLWPTSFQIMLPSVEALRQAQSVVAACGETYPYLALLRDKNLLFNRSRTAFIMYGVEGRTWLAMGDPVAPCDTERRELAWEFRELCEHHDGWSVFYQVHPQYLDFYVELGLTALKIGEEARIPLQTFSLQDERSRALRAALRQCKNMGMHFSIVDPGNVSSLLPRLKRISDAWVDQNNSVEGEFFLGFFRKNDWLAYPLALICEGADIMAFAVLRSDNGKRELAFDAVRYLPNVSVDIVDYLHIQTILWAKLQGYTWLSLGITPLVDLQDYGLTPLWNRFNSLMLGADASLNNFERIRDYKEKFYPLWEPRYLMLPAGIALPHILTDMTALVSRRGNAQEGNLVHPRIVNSSHY